MVLQIHVLLICPLSHFQITETQMQAAIYKNNSVPNPYEETTVKETVSKLYT